MIKKTEEMPEGARMSDEEDDKSHHLPEDDPHRALGNIVLDDLEDVRRPYSSPDMNLTSFGSENVPTFSSLLSS